MGAFHIDSFLPWRRAWKCDAKGTYQTQSRLPNHSQIIATHSRTAQFSWICKQCYGKVSPGLIVLHMFLASSGIVSLHLRWNCLLALHVGMNYSQHHVSLCELPVWSLQFLYPCRHSPSTCLLATFYLKGVWIWAIVVNLELSFRIYSERSHLIHI